MERLGLGVDELRQRHPRLIYVSISGVGETGPYVKKRVYDPIIQALSGFADIQSQPVTNRPQMIRTIVCDKTTAVFTAQAVAAALYAREKTGQGDHIQVAMLDAMISYLWPEGMMQYTVVGAETTAADPNDRPDLVFKTSDGYITAGTISDSEWQGFCRASGDPELAKDPRFATPSARSVNATARINKMAEYIGQHSTAEWLERLDAADVPCAPILRRGEIIHNEQVVARGIIAEFDQPKVGRVRQPKPAARFEINEAAIGGPAPRVGEHSRDVLRELGYDDSAIDKMVTERSVRVAVYPKSSRASGRRFLNLRRHRRDWCHRDIRRDSSLIGVPFLDAFEIGLRIVANANAIGDGPLKAGREQDVSAGKPVAHQELPVVCKCYFDMAQLLAEILAGLGNYLGRNTVDWTERVGPMAAHHVKAGRIQLRDDKETPFQPRGILTGGFRNQRAFRRGVHSRQVGNDCGALADGKVAVLKQRNLLARIELGVFRGLGLARSRPDRFCRVGQAQFVHGPVWANGAACANAPQGKVWRRVHVTTSPRTDADRAHGSSHLCFAGG